MAYLLTGNSKQNNNYNQLQLINKKLITLFRVFTHMLLHSGIILGGKMLTGQEPGMGRGSASVIPRQQRSNNQASHTNAPVQQWGVPPALQPQRESLGFLC